MYSSQDDPAQAKDLLHTGLGNNFKEYSMPIFKHIHANITAEAFELIEEAAEDRRINPEKVCGMLLEAASKQISKLLDEEEDEE